jgi:hypothetical protein
MTMKSTRVRNLTVGPLTIPGLIGVVIPPHDSVSLTATPDEVIAALGGNARAAKLAEIVEENYDYPLDQLLDVALSAAPGARIDLKAGTNDVAPIKLTAGDMVDDPQDGALEFDGLHFYVSIGGARYQVDQQSGGGPTALITALGVTPSEVEVGASVTNPAFTATYSRLVTSASINDGSGPTALTLPATAFTKTGVYTKIVVNAMQAFTLAAQVDLEPAQSRAVSIAWRPKVFFGVADVPGAYDGAFVEGLASSALAAARQRTIPFVAAPTNKLFYCYPDSYGGVPANFIDVSTGWQAGFFKAGTVSVTNGNGVTITYAIWESEQEGLGAVSIQVL